MVPVARPEDVAQAALTLVGGAVIVDPASVDLIKGVRLSGGLYWSQR